MSKVAIIPLQAFLDAKGDSELVANLAKSVEREAVAKYLSTQALSGNWSKGASMVLITVAARIKAGEHDV